MNKDKIKNYLPSKDFRKRVFFISIFLILFLVARYTIYPQIIGLFNKKNKIPESMTISGLVDSDQDSDGVPDWEESIWGTDPKKPDTDNDGISDFDFIKSKKMIIGEVENNETVIMSKEIMQVLLGLINKDIATDEAIQNLTSAAGETIINPTLENTFSYADIYSVPTSKASSAAYYKGFGSAYQTFAKSQAPDEFLLLAVAVSSENPDQLIDLDLTIKKYQTFLDKIKSLKVPTDAQNAHLDFINSLASIIKALEKSKDLYKNSVVGINGIAELRLAHTNLDKSIDQIGVFFKQQGLIN